jgi:hypothetical protein
LYAFFLCKDRTYFFLANIVRTFFLPK